MQARSWLVGLLALGLWSGCGSDRRATSYRPPSNGCTRGSLLPCQCANGSDGFSTCDGERYGACACEGVDAGPGPTPDSGFPPGPDAGFVDSGVPPIDAGFPDTGVPVEDAGFPDTGVRPDAGFPDTGIRPDAGFPDTGVRPDAGFPDSGTPPGPCTTDSDCGAPVAVCESGQCVSGCFSGDPNGITCTPPDECNPLTGRCGGLQLCFSDAECNPPVSVCLLILCAPGCAQPGASPCGSGTVCNPATGHCQ